MPTENRSSNTEQMFSVPRFLLEEACNGLRITQDRARKELRALLAQPSTQHQGEPVKTPARDESLGTAERDEYANGYRHGWNAYNDEMAKLGPLYTRPAPVKRGEPVARVEIGADRNAALTITDENWLRSLKDYGAHQLVPLYANAGEVEALQKHFDDVLESKELDCRLARGERDTLRAQLAERDARMAIINRKATEYACRSLPTGPECRFGDEIAALSASAEPSAPVERDERAEFDEWFRKDRGLHPGADTTFIGDAYQPWRGWQARAALERKP